MLKTTNEDIRAYLPGSTEKKSLKAKLEKLENQFDQEMTLKGVLYLIGVQELNLGIKS